MTEIDRRTLAKGVAWMAPAISIAAAAPSLAASTSAEHKVAGFGDKCPGQSNVPHGFPKHGYRLVLTISPKPSIVVPVSVLQGNSKYATIVTDATFNGVGWEFIVDAKSSPSKVTVTVLVDDVEHTVDIDTRPHCGKGASTWSR